jgi:hypothetical protein
MMRISEIKPFVLVLGLLMPTLWGNALGTVSNDGFSHITIHGTTVQDDPRNNSILAYINGHSLTVTFTENLGDVQVEITTASGGAVSYGHVWTPNSYIAYIPNTGSYVVTITLPNGDEYYGEFDVTD